MVGKCCVATGNEDIVDQITRVPRGSKTADSAAMGSSRRSGGSGRRARIKDASNEVLVHKDYWLGLNENARFQVVARYRILLWVVVRDVVLSTIFHTRLFACSGSVPCPKSTDFKVTSYHKKMWSSITCRHGFLPSSKIGDEREQESWRPNPHPA